MSLINTAQELHSLEALATGIAEFGVDVRVAKTVFKKLTSWRGKQLLACRILHLVVHNSADIEGCEELIACNITHILCAELVTLCRQAARKGYFQLGLIAYWMKPSSSLARLLTPSSAVHFPVNVLLSIGNRLISNGLERIAVCMADASIHKDSITSIRAEWEISWAQKDPNWRFQESIGAWVEKTPLKRTPKKRHNILIGTPLPKTQPDSFTVYPLYFTCLYSNKHLQQLLNLPLHWL